MVLINKKIVTCHLVNFDIPAENRVKINWKIYMKLGRKMEKRNYETRR